jgi:hypothetical protein
MAVQAPYNWGPVDSEAFFTRHFFRALLQRIFVDHGIIPQPGSLGSAVEGLEVPSTPLIVGSMRKAAFSSFPAYARAAMAKLVQDPHYGKLIEQKLPDFSDAQLAAYVETYKGSKKNLSIVWSLMAFSAAVVESIIVTDRWLFLREQDAVKDCWVEPVFEYSQSPRNLVVVGVKE